MKIAVVGTKKEIVAAFCEFLRSLGVGSVHAVYSQKEAQVCKNQNHDLVFLDIDFPDAVKLVEGIKNLNRQTQVVVISDGGQQDTALQKMQVEFLTRPFQVNELRQILQKFDKPRSYDKVKAALVSVVIEQALLKLSPAAANEVGDRLYTKYGCYFSDCLQHPEYLKNVLEEIFGNAGAIILNEIKQNLADFKDQQPIAEFLAELND